MWTCECGERIEDQFDACWRCAGRNTDAPEIPAAKDPIKIKCPHCKSSLEYLGKKRFSDGGHLFVDRENFDLYACSRCGHVEFFLAGVGEEFRPKDAQEDDKRSQE